MEKESHPEPYPVNGTASIHTPLILGNITPVSKDLRKDI